MADTKLSALTAFTTPQATDELYANDGGVSKKITYANLEAAIASTANVTAAGALMDSEVTNLAAVKAFDPTDYATAAQGATADSALQNVSEDTTPQLGGSLDVNGQKIVSASNGNIDIEPNGTGNVLLGNFTFDADQAVGAGQDNYVLTYDNASGLISLEAAAGGGGDLWSDAVDSDIVPTGADGTYDLGTTTDRFAQTYTDTIWITDGDITASVADGASAVAFDFNNTATLSTTGSKIARFSNNGVEKAYIDKDGHVFTGGRIYLDANKYIEASNNHALNHISFVANGSTIPNWGVGETTDDRANILSATGIHLGSDSNYGATKYIRITSDLDTDVAPSTLEIVGGNARASAVTNLDGGSIIITAGAGASGSAGDADGGHVYLNGGQGYGTGDHGDVIIGNTHGDLQFANAYTVATLPTGVVGKVARVTDASGPSVGSTVSGGGAAAALVWYNGSAWSVIGV